MPTSEARPGGDLRSLSKGGRGTPDPAAPLPPRPPYPWKTRILVPALPVVAVLALLGYATRQALWPAKAVRVIPVVLKAATVDAGAPAPVHGGAPGGVVAQAAGWIEADPYAVDVSALTDGIVKDVLVLEGQPVKAGQVVARLVDDDARLGLARTEAMLNERRAALVAAQTTWDNPVDRTRAVATTDALLAQAKAELARLDAEVAVEAARVEELTDELSRTEKTAAVSASTDRELVSTRLRLKAQQAMVEATTGKRPMLEAQVRHHEAELIEARDNLRLRIQEARELETAKAAVAVAQAMRDEAALRLSRTEVRSPADGIVMARLIEPGSKLMAGMDDPRSAMAVRLYDPRHLQVRVDVPLADAAKVGVGTRAEVSVAVLPDRTFAGEISRVVHEADLSKNTLQVKVRLTDPAVELKPEMLARAKFYGGSRAMGEKGPTAPAGGAGDGGQVLFAPESLVNGGEAWVVDRATGTAKKRKVELGDVRQAGWIAVTSGLNAGDQLIADPSGLEEGTRVRVTGEASVVNHGGGHHDIH
jgi:RND family efflux transporter MFP subunit